MQICEYGNFAIHYALRNLRPPGKSTVLSVNLQCRCSSFAHFRVSCFGIKDAVGYLARINACSIALSLLLAKISVLHCCRCII